MRASRHLAVSWLAVILVFILWAPSLGAVEIVGQVMNATTGKPLEGNFVNLLALRGQMVPIRETQTDSEGRFRFVVAANPSERFLVQVPYRGVIYSRGATLSAGEKITADLEVYEADARPEDVSVEAHTIFLEPHSDHVRVNEFFAIHNHSRPPRTYAPDRASFSFALPETVGDLQVSAGRPGGVSLRQQPQPTETPNTFSLDYAFKPAETEIHLSYVVPSSETALDLTLPLFTPAKRRHIAVPRAGVELKGSDLEEIAQTQAPQVRVFEVKRKAPGQLDLRLSIDPEALEAAAAAPSPPTPAGAQGENTVQIVPHPVSEAQWYIVGLLLVVLSLGLYYLYTLRLPVSATDASDQQPAQPARR